MCRFLLRTEDFLIGSFLNRLKMLLKHLTIGRITVKGTESLSDEQKERQFLPAGLRAEPYDREDPVATSGCSPKGHQQRLHLFPAL